MLPDVDHDVEVPRGGHALSGGTTALHPDALAVLDPGRDAHLDRTHLALAKETPGDRVAEKNPGAGWKVVSMPRLGGMHHRYDLAA